MNFHHYLWLLSAFQHRLLEVLVVNVVQFWEGCPAEIMFPRGGMEVVPVVYKKCVYSFCPYSPVLCWHVALVYPLVLCCSMGKYFSS